MLQAEKRKQEEIRNEEVATRENHRIGKSLQVHIEDVDSNPCFVSQIVECI